METEGKFQIYTLSHKDEIRYVGITTKKYLSQRLAGHIYAAKRTKRLNHRVNWIRSVNYDIQISLHSITDNLGEEIVIIKKFLDNGYRLVNTSKGGECQWCEGMPQVTKDKISIAIKNHPTRGKSISESLKGKVLSAETRKKISKSLTGKTHPASAIKKKSNPVIQIGVREWPSINEAFRQTGISKGAISNVCSGKQKSAGGYKWKFKDIV
jgi:hypothetical protein